MVKFLYHPGIEKEIAALERRFKTIRAGFSNFERLCEVQFNPTSPKTIIGPAKLHRITQNDIWTIWKVELVIPNSGLRPNQWPRLWFVVKGDIIAFLAISSHIDNYQDKEMDRLALSRLSDLL